MKTKISVLCSVCGGTERHNKLFSGLECPMKKKKKSRDRHNAIS